MAERSKAVDSRSTGLVPTEVRIERKSSSPHQLYLYHKVPENMTGTILYPLNKLKTILPKVYKEQLKKYKGREKLLKDRIPPLKCFWNDVLHLTPIHPRKIKTALAEAGVKLPQEKFFEIPATSLEPKRAIIYKFTSYELSPSQFEIFTSTALKRYAEVPAKAKEYYTSYAKRGKRVSRYRFIPHVLYKGNIDVSKAKILTI